MTQAAVATPASDIGSTTGQQPGGPAGGANNTMTPYGSGAGDSNSNATGQNSMPSDSKQDNNNNNRAGGKKGSLLTKILPHKSNDETADSKSGGQQNTFESPSAASARSPAYQTNDPAAQQQSAGNDTRQGNQGSIFTSANPSQAETRSGNHGKTDSVATVTPARNQPQGQNMKEGQAGGNGGGNAAGPAGANGPLGPSAQANANDVPPQSPETSVSGAFATGAATFAKPDPNASMHQRVETAEGQLDPKSLSKINKAEAKETKKQIKVIKNEGRTQEKTFASASADLAKQQKVQKAAAYDETKALKQHSKAVKLEHKLHSKFLAAKAKHEKALGDVKAREEALQSSRDHAQKATEALGTKSRAVEELRGRKAVDDREREVKLGQLQGSLKK